MNKVKVGVIGTGFMGKNHVRVFSELSSVELVAIADIDEHRVDKQSQDYGIAGYYNYLEMLEKEDLNAVSIAVPTSLHTEVVLQTLNYVNNIFVEKPLTSNLEDCKTIIDEVSEKNAKLMVGHIERFNPAILKLKELLNNHSLGEIISLSTERVGPYLPRIRDAGVIVDNAIHDIDVMRFLTERKVNLVYARTGSRKTDFDDYASILLEFEGNILGTIEVNRLTPTKIRNLSVTCSDGFVKVDYISQDISVYGKVLDTHYNDYEELIFKFGNPEIGKPKVERQEPLKLELQHFIECIQTGKQPLVDVYEGYENLKVANRALDSAKHNLEYISIK